MKNITYNTDSYTQERTYTDYYDLQVDLDNLCTVVMELQDTMWKELNSLPKIYPGIEKATECLEKRVTALHLVADKLYTLARECEATDNKPQGE